MGTVQVRGALVLRPHRLASAFAMAAIVVGAARGQEAETGGPFRVLPVPGAFAPGAVVAAGDLDGDGFGDLAAADPNWYEGGRVHLLSGADGTVLRTLEGIGPGMGQGDGFGHCVASLGDIDGRGKTDFLVGAPRGQGGVPEASRPTYAKAFAGEDGAVLFDSGPRPSDAQFGLVVAGLGDLDGDGSRDFAVSSMDRVGEGAFDGSVHVFSGASGDSLATLESGTPNEYFGTSIAALGDVDGDGRADFAIGAPGHTRGRKVHAGRVSVVSGATLQEIRSIPGRRARDRFGIALAALGSSVPDAHRLLVGSSPALDASRGSVELVDAATGARIRRFRGGGSTVAALGDQDSDGSADFVRSRWTFGDDRQPDGGRLVEVISGAQGRVLLGLRGWPYEVSLPFAAGDVDGDGREDLAVSNREGEAAIEVRVYRVPDAPVHRSVRVDLQRPAGQLGADHRFHGLATVSPGGPRQPIGLDLPSGPVSGQVQIETAPGSGQFLKVGEVHPVFTYNPRTGYPSGTRGSIVVLDGDVALAAVGIRRSSLAELAGRILRVTVQVAPDLVLLQARVPPAGVPEFRGRSRLAPPDPSDEGLPSGSVRVASRGDEGTLRIEVAARRLPPGAEYALWIEDAAGVGTFSEAGPVLRGRLVLDTARGDPIPGIASGGAELTGRTVEVRAADVVVLRGTMP